MWSWSSRDLYGVEVLVFRVVPEETGVGARTTRVRREGESCGRETEVVLERKT